MTDEELDAIELRTTNLAPSQGSGMLLVYDRDFDALVAEVRYWRALVDAVVRDHTLLPVSRRSNDHVEYWDDDAKGWVDHPVENGLGR